VQSQIDKFMELRQEKYIYPFSAIVGQQEMKQALLLNVIYPAIGGVLVKGERGAAKSTVVRGLANLLPPIEVVADCPFQCHPSDRNQMCGSCLERSLKGEKLPSHIRKRRVVNLPIGITEDRLLGALDLETAISEGRKQFEPGLLAEANRAFLYVDEVNLLSDHIVDLLLDVAAMGVNRVEREGLSFSHPSRFILVGTMNPEEGDLRPQLLDRFGLCVEVVGVADIEGRAQIVRRRLDFEDHPELFLRTWRDKEDELAAELESARRRLDQVEIPDRMIELAGRLSLSMEVEGHRSDITIVKAAKGLAALDGAPAVTEKELIQAAEMALRHRLRQRGLTETKFNRKKVERELEKISEEELVNAPPAGYDIKKKISHS